MNSLFENMFLVGMSWLPIIFGFIVLLYILYVIFREGIGRTFGYIIRFLEEMFYAIVFRLMQRLSLLSIISLFFTIFNIIAQGLILCAPLILYRPGQNVFSSVKTFIQSGWLLPIALVYLWIYKTVRSGSRKTIPIPRHERERLTDTSVTIMKIKEELSKDESEREFNMIRRSLLEDINRKIWHISGQFRDVELHSAILIPVFSQGSSSPDRMRVIARSGHRRVGAEYPMGLLAAGDAFQSNLACVVHRLKYFAKEKRLNAEEKRQLLEKPYKSVLALPMRSTNNNGEPMVVGCVSIDANLSYYFRGKGIDLDISLRPYINILALTLPNDTPKFTTERIPNYLKH